MSLESISLAEARSLMLAAQGLDRPPLRPATKADVLAAIRRMGALQIDTISVVARSPYLVLWSRLGDYDPAWLDELLAERALFEYWSHAMCFLPIEDYPLYRRFMLQEAQRPGDSAKWVAQHPEVTERVLQRIRQEGGLRSADFESDQQPTGGWWNWKDEKIALECLLTLGELMVARRQGFQRIYDLPARLLPGVYAELDPAQAPPRDEALTALTLQTVDALGVTLAGWAPDYFRLPKTGNAARLEALAQAGRILPVQIEGLPGPAYRSLAARVDGPPQVTALLTPFDPLVWDRKRIKDLFNYDYTIECYTPAAKRRFGYYVMPILHRDALVGRLDPKAHRADGLFEVKAVALEPGVEPGDDLVEGLGAALRRMAAWHGTPEVVIRRSTPEGLAGRLQEAIARG